jgi:hypothetical protein
MNSYVRWGKGNHNLEQPNFGCRRIMQEQTFPTWTHARFWRGPMRITRRAPHLQLSPVPRMPCKAPFTAPRERYGGALMAATLVAEIH